jgi:hypothetical protein
MINKQKLKLCRQSSKIKEIFVKISSSRLVGMFNDLIDLSCQRVGKYDPIVSKIRIPTLER